VTCGSLPALTHTYTTFSPLLKLKARYRFHYGQLLVLLKSRSHFIYLTRITSTYYTATWNNVSKILYSFKDKQVCAMLINFENFYPRYFCVLHEPPITPSLTWSSLLQQQRHYVIYWSTFSMSWLFLPSYVQIVYTATCSRTVYRLSLPSYVQIFYSATCSQTLILQAFLRFRDKIYTCKNTITTKSWHSF
jgi:hypothetical protein